MVPRGGRVVKVRQSGLGSSLAVAGNWGLLEGEVSYAGNMAGLEEEAGQSVPAGRAVLVS